ncbi:MAG: hypothetical protein ACYTFA_03410 [Planctomycetota bacterium]|jgi:hypothetical protein
MALIGWAALGIVIGAAGSEFLRTHKRELVEKVEKAASRFVDALLPSRTHDNEAGGEASEATEDE